MLDQDEKLGVNHSEQEKEEEETCLMEKKKVTPSTKDLKSMFRRAYIYIYL